MPLQNSILLYFAIGCAVLTFRLKQKRTDIHEWDSFIQNPGAILVFYVFGAWIWPWLVFKIIINIGKNDDNK